MVNAFSNSDELPLMKLIRSFHSSVKLESLGFRNYRVPMVDSVDSFVSFHVGHKRDRIDEWESNEKELAPK